MNDTADAKLKALKEFNASMKQLNTRLEDLFKSRNEDKLKYLRDLNAQMREMNVHLAELLESREKDAIRNELHRAKQ